MLRSILSLLFSLALSQNTQPSAQKPMKSGFGPLSDASFIVIVILSIIIVVAIIVFACFNCGCYACCCWTCIFNSYQQNYGLRLDKSKTKEKDFGKQVKDFEIMLNQVMSKKRNFGFRERREDKKIELIGFQMQKKKKAIYAVIIQGSDYLGTWKGVGEILSSGIGPFFWMLKRYDNRKKADQLGRRQILVYQSQQIDGRSCRGKWFYQGFEDTDNYSGSWSISELPATRNNLMSLEQLNSHS